MLRFLLLNDTTVLLQLLSFLASNIAQTTGYDNSEYYCNPYGSYGSGGGHCFMTITIESTSGITIDVVSLNYNTKYTI